MKKKLFAIFAPLFLIAAIAWGATDPTYQALVHMNGPDEQVIESGGKITVLSGGIVDVESGGLLKIAGTQITPTAAQFNFLAGVTAGTSAASKAVVLSSASKIDTIDMTAWKIGGTSVTATAAQLNWSAVTTAGTAESFFFIAYSLSGPGGPERPPGMVVWCVYRGGVSRGCPLISKSACGRSGPVPVSAIVAFRKRFPPM